MLIPVVMLFLALSVDIGNWWVHKRHLQLQVDAAALAGGALLGECFTDPGGRELGDHERGDALRRRRRVELQRAARRRPTRARSRSPTRATRTRPAPPIRRRHRDAAPCDTRHLMFDVKASEAGMPLLLARSSSSSLRGDARRPDDQRPRTRRAEAGRDPGGDAPRRGPRSPLQLRLRDVRQRGHGRRPRHGPADEGRHERRRPALEHDDADLGLDPLGARRRPDPARRRRRPDRRLRHALHRVLRHRLHQRCRPHPRLEHRHRPGGAERLAARRAHARRTRTSRPPTAAPGSRPRSTSAPAPAHRHRRDRRRLGERRRRRPLLAHARAAPRGSSRGPRPAGFPSPSAGRTPSS